MFKKLQQALQTDSFAEELELFLKNNSLEYTSKDIKEAEKKRLQIQDVKNNPYLLLEFFGFKKIDKAMSCKDTDRNRITACIIYSLDKMLEASGHTVVNEEQLIIDICKELNLNPTQEQKNSIKSAINILIGKKVIRQINEIFITSEKYYLMEKFIRDMLSSFTNRTRGIIKNSQAIESFINEEEKNIGFSYADQQKDGIRLANQNFCIFSLNGYAGSGKTTTALSILNLFSSLYGVNKVTCCAFSGMAANRARITTGYNSVTLHSLLGYDGEVFTKDENNKLEYSFIMLDEAGMVSSELFYNLLKAIDFSRTTLMIAGDNAQLQSIGNGDVYNNILTRSLCKTVSLDKVYRQKETQVINIIAQSIRVAKIPLNYTCNDFDDFKFINATGENIIDTLRNISKKYIIKQNEYLAKGDYDKFLANFQVIIPIKKGIYGVHNINNVLQKVFNSSADMNYKEIENQVQHTVIKSKDKVIHLKNQKMRVVERNVFEEHKDNIQSIPGASITEIKIFNGQMGIVLNVTKKDTFVYFPDNNIVVLYSSNDITKYGLLDLAYAITVHKSQGSQYGTVLLPMTSQYSRMLNNKLLYTATTRAKDMLYIVGENTSFAKGCQTSTEIKRETILNYL